MSNNKSFFRTSNRFWRRWSFERSRRCLLRWRRVRSNSPWTVQISRQFWPSSRWRSETKTFEAIKSRYQKSLHTNSGKKTRMQRWIWKCAKIGSWFEWGRFIGTKRTSRYVFTLDAQKKMLFFNQPRIRLGDFQNLRLGLF